MGFASTGRNSTENEFSGSCHSKLSAFFAVKSHRFTEMLRLYLRGLLHICHFVFSDPLAPLALLRSSKEARKSFSCHVVEYLSSYVEYQHSASSPATLPEGCGLEFKPRPVECHVAVHVPVWGFGFRCSIYCP